MKPISRRMQLGFVAVGYASVAAVSAGLLYTRHLVALQNPVEASGGMFAFGDTLLEFFLGFLFLIPTVFLIWIMARVEDWYKRYSKFLLGLSLSAPVCLVLFLLGDRYVPQSIGWICLFRIMWSPIVLVAMAFSRWMARFDRAKRLATYALLVEGMTLGTAAAVFIDG